MFLYYVDESGDPGLANSPSRYFVLTAIAVHELRWRSVLEQTLNFRRRMRGVYGLRLREEIHAAHFLHKPKALVRIEKSLRLRLLRDSLDFVASLTADISVVNVVCDKQGKPDNYDVFEKTWQAIIQRLHNTLSNRNFAGPKNSQDYGVLVADRTGDEKKLRNLVRRMRVYNPVPSMLSSGYRQILIDTLIEDPVHRDSLHSYPIQLCDVSAYFCYQKLDPCGYVQRKGARNYFDRLEPVLCKVASRSDPQGIVRL